MLPGLVVLLERRWASSARLEDSYLKDLTDDMGSTQHTVRWVRMLVSSARTQEYHPETLQMLWVTW